MLTKLTYCWKCSTVGCSPWTMVWPTISVNTNSGKHKYQLRIWGHLSQTSMDITFLIIFWTYLQDLIVGICTFTGSDYDYLDNQTTNWSSLFSTELQMLIYIETRKESHNKTKQLWSQTQWNLQKIRDKLYNFFKFKVCFQYFKFSCHYTCWQLASKIKAVSVHYHPLPLDSSVDFYIVGVGRVQIIRVDYSQIKTRLDIEPSRHLVSTITGNDIQYGGSRKRKKYKDKSFESLELAIVST